MDGASLAMKNDVSLIVHNLTITVVVVKSRFFL
jgi:hypothetical protein